MRGRTLLGVLLAVAIVAAVAGWAIGYFAFDSDGDSQAVERVADDATAPPSQELDLTVQSTLPALPPPVARRRPNFEAQRQTPVAETATPLLASNVAQTDVKDANDPSGSGEAFAVFQNTVVHKGSALFIAEPNVASKGDRMMVVWNLGAAFSSDGGKTFTYVDPKRPEFPQDKGRYCCDQVVLYLASHDLWIWFIQYYPPAPGEPNIVRIAYSQGDAAFDRREFAYYDFTASDFATLALPKADLDYPNIAATDEHLFLSINAFTEVGYRNSVILRIPLDQIVTGNVQYRYSVSPLGTADFADGTGDTMYYAQHVDTSSLRVFSWAEGDESPTSTDVAHANYPYVRAGFTCDRDQAPGGDWCARLVEGEGGVEVVNNDDRPTDGWATGDEIGFSWNVPRAPDRGFPQPFVHMIRIDRTTMTVKDEPVVWHPDYAFMYGTLAPNERGDLGGVALSGSGSGYQTCTTLIRDAGGTAWDARAVATSNADPARSESGDFLGAVARRPGSNAWAGTCMTLAGGSAPANVEIRLVQFGRAKDAEGG